MNNKERILENNRKYKFRVNELLKLEDGKIKCRNPKLKAKVKSYLIPEYEADSLHVIPKNSEVEVLNETERGSGGFGSTGV